MLEAERTRKKLRPPARVAAQRQRASPLLTTANVVIGGSRECCGVEEGALEERYQHNDGDEGEEEVNAVAGSRWRI